MPLCPLNTQSNDSMIHPKRKSSEIDHEPLKKLCVNMCMDLETLHISPFVSRKRKSTHDETGDAEDRLTRLTHTKAFTGTSMKTDVQLIRQIQQLADRLRIPYLENCGLDQLCWLVRHGLQRPSRP